MTDYCAQGVLNHITGRAQIFTLPTALYLALFTTAGTDNGSGFAEAAFGGYARVGIPPSSWNAAQGSAPSSITTSATVAFSNCTSAPGAPIVAWGLFTAATGGNLLEWDYVYAGGAANAGQWVPFTSAAGANPAVIESPAHGFTSGDQIVVTNEYGGTLPAAATGAWAGPLTVTVLTADTFTCGVATTSSGDGSLRKIIPQAMVINLAISFPAGDITLTLA